MGGERKEAEAIAIELEDMLSADVSAAAAWVVGSEVCWFMTIFIVGSLGLENEAFVLSVWLRMCE